jgi:hypothetical protein
MNSITKNMHITTPLGNEDFTVHQEGNTLKLSNHKGFIDLMVIESDSNKVVARGHTTIPFDCIVLFELSSDAEMPSHVSLLDPFLNEEFLSLECKEV